MRLSFEFSGSVVFFAGGAVFDWDWLWDCVLSGVEAAFGNRGISSSEGKLGEGFPGGRRLLTRGTSAAAKSKIAEDKASQLDVIRRANPAIAGPTSLIR